MQTSIILSMVSFTLFLQLQQKSMATETDLPAFTGYSDKKTEAFKILNTKCNACHLTKNPGRIFTLENMNSFAPEIHKQVFVRKRMPKGKNYKLSGEELLVLKNWVNEVSEKGSKN